MCWYDRVWTAVTGGICAAAVVAAFHVWPPLALSAVFLVMGVMCVIVVLPWLPKSDSWTWPITKAVVTGGLASWLALGLGHLAGAAGLAVGALLVVLAPALLARYSLVATRVGLRPPGRGPREKVPDPYRSVLPVPALATGDLSAEQQLRGLEVPDLMTDFDLCQAWRSSYVALQRATSVESRLRVVTIRALYLDELERRAAPAVRTWLASGARAASDPSRYLPSARRHGTRPGVD